MKPAPFDRLAARRPRLALGLLAGALIVLIVIWYFSVIPHGWPAVVIAGVFGFAHGMIFIRSSLRWSVAPFWAGGSAVHEWGYGASWWFGVGVLTLAIIIATLIALRVDAKREDL